MPARTLTCPECDVLLKISDAIPAGKKIRCPTCKAIFRIPDVDGAVRVKRKADPDAPAGGKRSRVRDEEVEDDSDMDEEEVESRRDRRRTRRKKKKANPLLVTSIIVGSVLLLAGALFAVVLIVLPDGKKKVVVQAGPKLAQRDVFTGPGGFKGPKPGQNPVRPPAGIGTAVGQQALEIQGEDLDGKTFKLSDYRGKVVLLDFWGNW